MSEGRVTRPPQPGNRASEDTLPPILLPFTIHAATGTAPESVTERSLGHRLGLWWEEIGGPEGGVVVTGIRPGSPAAAGQTIAVGDMIVEVDGSPVRNLADIVRGFTIGAPESLQLTVKMASDGSRRSVTIQMPPTPPGPSAAAAASLAAARVPTTIPNVSVQKHIECILCNPLQREVTHPGVSADPDFGCLGADLEFGIQSVGLSEMRNAIVQSEHRLKDVEVFQHDLEVREDGETHMRPGIRVEAKLAASGQAVKIELEVLELTRKRRSNRFRRSIRQGEEPGP